MQTLAGNWKFAKAAVGCRLAGNCTLPNASKMQSISTADYAYNIIQRELWPHPLIMVKVMALLTRKYCMYSRYMYVVNGVQISKLLTLAELNACLSFIAILYVS